VGTVTDSGLTNANQHRRTTYDNVIRLLGGQPHTLLRALNAVRITYTHITDTLKALAARDWQQSFPSLNSDAQRRSELIIAMDTLKLAHKEAKKAENRVYDS